MDKSRYPCGICSKTVAKNHNAVSCDICDLWVHISCNNITKYCYRKLQKDKSPWYCKTCIKNIIPFSELTDNQFDKTMQGNLVITPKLVIDEHRISSPDFGSAIKNEL